jgi:hypothetical protein
MLSPVMPRLIAKSKKAFYWAGLPRMFLQERPVDQLDMDTAATELAISISSHAAASGSAKGLGSMNL